MTKPLEKLTELSKSFGETIYQLSRPILENFKFPIWSGSAHKGAHHYGAGQLAVHTLEVIELSLQNNAYFKAANKQAAQDGLLFLAGLYHDIGKTYDYETTDFINWTYGDAKFKIHHITRSALIWEEEAKKIGGISEAERNDVLHAILAHHGRKEWGSPVEPETHMAWLLHLADMTSAKMFSPCFRKK